MKTDGSNGESSRMALEMRAHLLENIIPFWKNLKDEERGGYFGYVSYDLETDKEAEKGCILNSRILWFFSNAGRVLGEKGLLAEAAHAYDFLKKYCVDGECGGLYWSVTANGEPLDTTKHTYNQAFGIYALSAYYQAAGEEEALKLAVALYRLIEERCRDKDGYLESFTRDFRKQPNEKLSGNGVMAHRTMNTLLHVFEAYTGLYRVWPQQELKEKLLAILDIFAEKIYNPARCRQEVFFDEAYNSLVDMHSYGHDIETSWLLDEGLEVLGEKAYAERVHPISDALVKQVYTDAFDGHSVANEFVQGKVDEHRVWWVQAEAVVGFVNAFMKRPEETRYREAAERIWEFIKEFVMDKRENGEWFWEVTPKGDPYPDRPIVEPWKCPYHNGRMCMEIINRMIVK